MKLADRVFQIFQTGRHTSMNGMTLDYAELDLRYAATNYNQGRRRATLTIGHPSDDRPELGYVASLFAKGGKLFAHGRVSEPLVKAVREGRYKSVSASFFDPFHPRNPHPGYWSLKHVGFLGAVAPAVLGMDALEFATFTDDECACFAYACGQEACAAHDSDPEFAAPKGVGVDPAAMSLYRLACEYRRACPDLSITEAGRLAAPYAIH